MEFRILGSLDVLRDGQTVPLGGAKQRAVLAILLLRAGEVVSTDRLIDDLWGEHPPSTAEHTIQVYVSNLRKALAGAQKEQRSYLLTKAPGYLLQVEPDELDLHRFERLAEEGRAAYRSGDAARASELLRAALALWSGPALADFAYETFAQAVAARLEELRLAALEDRIEADLALGRHAELVGELEAIVAQYPLRERPRGQLILALYRAGRQAEALEAYQQTRRTLVEELGIDPSPTLQRLEKAILTQDPSLELAATKPVAQAAALSKPARSILIVPDDPGRLESLLALAEPLAGSRAPHELIVSRLIPAGEAGALSTETGRMAALRDGLAEKGVASRAAAFTSADPAADTVRLASEQQVDLLLLDCPPTLLASGVFPEATVAVLAEAPCDVGLHVERDAAEGPVLVPFGGSENDWSALELSAWIASATERPLRLLGTAAEPDEGRRDASRLLASASLAVQSLVGIAAELALAEAGPTSILEAAEAAALLVLGLSERWHTEGLGETRLAIARDARPPLILVRSGLRPGGLAPAAQLTRFTWSLGAAAPCPPGP